MRKGRFLDDSNNDEISDDQKKNGKTKKKKTKNKKGESTKDDFKGLQEEIEGLALGSKKFCTCMICR